MDNEHKQNFEKGIGRTIDIKGFDSALWNEVDHLRGTHKDITINRAVERALERMVQWYKDAQSPHIKTVDIDDIDSIIEFTTTRRHSCVWVVLLAKKHMRENNQCHIN